MNAWVSAPVAPHDQQRNGTHPASISLMKIAILGWGSLIWDPRDLPRESFWERPGASLPLEFSRVSSDGRLTLVIDRDHGDESETYYAVSPRADLKDAVEDLRIREGTPDKTNIGFVDLKRGRHQGREPKTADVIRAWAQEQHFEGVVWTDLKPNFSKQTGTSFSVAAAVAYLANLPLTARRRALQYIANAPEEISTPLRRELARGDIGAPESTGNSTSSDSDSAQA